jgi:hypothetical protein
MSNVTEVTVALPSLDIAEFLKQTILRATKQCAIKNHYLDEKVNSDKFNPIVTFMESMGIVEPTAEQIKTIITFVCSITSLSKKEVEEFLSVRAKEFVHVPWAAFVDTKDTEIFILNPLARTSDECEFGVTARLTCDKRLQLDSYLASMRPATETEIEGWCLAQFSVKKEQRIASGLHSFYIALLLSGLVTDEKKLLNINLA